MNRQLATSSEKLVASAQFLVALATSESQFRALRSVVCFAIMASPDLNRCALKIGPKNFALHTYYLKQVCYGFKSSGYFGKPGLEIISGYTPDTMPGQIHFSSVMNHFWPVKLYKINNS